MRNDWCLFPFPRSNAKCKLRLPSAVSIYRHVPWITTRTLEDNAVPDDISLDTRDEVHVGYLPGPPLHRLMELRNALLALNGPLGSDPGLQANLRKHWFNEETSDRVLGKLNGAVSP
jgi:type VI secretion system protein ImpB